MKIVKALWSNPRWTAFWILLILVAAFLLFVPKFVITSGSMQPTLPVYSIVVMEAAEDLEPTDIITFQQEGDEHPTTHTFIGYAEDGSLMTKGDANLTPDVHNPPLQIEDVKGEVAYTIFPRDLLIFAGAVIVGLIVIPGRRKTEKDDDADEGEAQSTTDTSNRVTNPA